MNANARSGDCLAGVDEAGRGPLAGPVCAAAVILHPGQTFDGLDDSKRLSRKKRAQLAPQIREHARSWAVAFADVEEIDRINILQATLVAMRRAIEALSPRPQRVQVDGNTLPTLSAPYDSCQLQGVVGGDGLVPAISAASVLAKEARDALMRAWHEHYPHYGFDRHKGYGTAVHMKALQLYGPCELHRYSFAPVQAASARLDLGMPGELAPSEQSDPSRGVLLAVPRLIRRRPPSGQMHE